MRHSARFSTLLPSRVFPALLGLLLVTLASDHRPAAGQEIDDTPTREALFNKAEAAVVSQRLRTEPRLLRTFAACPADTFEQERPLWQRLAKPQEPSERTCAQHPAECYNLCVGWANGPACFRLAETYTHHLLDVEDVLDKERFYALACASSFPAGCTNRAAGMRNGRYAGDPLREKPIATQYECEYRSFLMPPRRPAQNSDEPRPVRAMRPSVLRRSLTSVSSDTSAASAVRKSMVCASGPLRRRSTP